MHIFYAKACTIWFTACLELLKQILCFEKKFVSTQTNSLFREKVWINRWQTLIAPQLLRNALHK